VRRQQEPGEAGQPPDLGDDRFVLAGLLPECLDIAGTTVDQIPLGGEAHGQVGMLPAELGQVSRPECLGQQHAPALFQQFDRLLGLVRLQAARGGAGSEAGDLSELEFLIRPGQAAGGQ
jgi:hypothetical protein